MISTQPLQSTGMLMRQVPGSSRLEFLGTCFLFRHDFICLTAAHCVPDGENLLVIFPMLQWSAEVVTVHRHWTKDVAVLILDKDGSAPSVAAGGVFVDCPEPLGLGIDFMAFGFPEGAANPISGAIPPTPRLFKGHVQRLFDFLAPYGSAHFAAEMSVPAPNGLSGGPVFHVLDHGSLLGIVTDNFESHTVRAYTESITAPDGSTQALQKESVVSYGIALVLSRVGYWLRTVVPDHPELPPISGDLPDTGEQLRTIHDLVEGGGARFRSFFINPESRELVLHVYGTLDESTTEQIREFVRLLSVELALFELEEGAE